MTEVFKEFLSVIGARIKSNVFGYILFVFLLLNWRPLFFLFFEDSDVSARLTYFDTHTNALTLFLFPVVFGFSAALFVPWVSYVSTFLVARPVRLHNRLQVFEALSFQIEKARQEAELQGIEERRIIEAAKVRDEAKEIKDPELREALVQDLNASEKDTKKSLNTEDIFIGLSEIESQILLQIGATKSGKVSIYEASGGYTVFIENEKKIIDGRKRYLAMREALIGLAAKNIFMKNSQGEYEMTSFGYKVFDYAKKRNST